MGPADSWYGPLITVVDGPEFVRPVWLGCPGDWPAFKDGQPNPDEWSTLRLGPHLVAVGPAVGPGMPLVSAALRQASADRVPADDLGRRGR